MNNPQIVRIFFFILVYDAKIRQITGRPVKFQTCYLANEIHRRIGQLAKRRNLSRTAIIRMAIDQGLPAVERALEKPASEHAELSLGKSR